MLDHESKVESNPCLHLAPTVKQNFGSYLFPISTAKKLVSWFSTPKFQ
uniref:Uncharacterized protein n=1 Tax=Arundo donax TaxID=35708 RepID=A0A0A9AXE7_ARUDO